MELTIEQKREIVIADLKKAMGDLQNMDEEHVLYRELTTIENAIEFLESLPKLEEDKTEN